MLSTVKINLLLSTISDLFAVYLLFSAQTDLYLIFAYLFITTFIIWAGEFFKGFIVILSDSKDLLIIIIGMFFVAGVLVQLMNVSIYSLWYYATGTGFILFDALNSILSSQLLYSILLTIASVGFSFIFYFLNKGYSGRLGAISLFNSILYPICFVFVTLFLGFGILLFFKDIKIAVLILFIVISFLNKAIIIVEDKFFKEKKRPIPDFVIRLANRSK